MSGHHKGKPFFAEFIAQDKAHINYIRYAADLPTKISAIRYALEYTAQALGYVEPAPVAQQTTDSRVSATEK